MKNKIVLTGITLAAAFAAYKVYGSLQNKKNANENSAEPFDPDKFILPPSEREATPQPKGHNFFEPVLKTNRAAVVQMQKMLGVQADGLWGPVTEAAIPFTLRKRPFTLAELHSHLGNRSTDNKKGAEPKWWEGGAKPWYQVNGLGEINISSVI